MEWTSRMQAKRYPDLYDSTGHLIPSRFRDKYKVPNKPKVPSKDTVTRKGIIAEIEKRCEAGEELSKIADDIASRKAVQDTFDYLINNNIDLSQVFQNMYKTKKKNASIVEKIEGRF